MPAPAQQHVPVFVLAIGLGAALLLLIGCASPGRPAARAYVGSQGASWDVVFPTGGPGPTHEGYARRDASLGVRTPERPEGFWPDRTPRFDRPYWVTTSRSPETHLQFRREGRMRRYDQ